jgi:hypothetical protein
MKEFPKPTSILLVGTFFIFIYLGSSVGQSNLFGPGELVGPKDLNYDLLHQQKNSDLGQLKLTDNTIYFPWASRHIPELSTSLSASRPSLLPASEKILLDSSNSKARVQDLFAINAAKQRDLIYADSQNRGPGDQSLVNSLGISVKGDGNNAGDGRSEVNSEDNNAMQSLEDAFNLGTQKNGVYNQESSAPRSRSSGNYLNVEVSGISVNAINTMEGGSAVATSNIFIEPVQTIIYSPEVEEKLR